MNLLFKALSDETRRGILELLTEGDLSAGDIATHFTLSKPSISHHLNVLKEADLVLAEKQGNKIIYSLNTTVFHEAVKWIYNTMSRGEKE